MMAPPVVVRLSTMGATAPILATALRQDHCSSYLGRIIPVLIHSSHFFSFTLTLITNDAMGRNNTRENMQKGILSGC